MPPITTGAEPHKPELVKHHANGRNGDATAPAEGRDHARLARAGAFEPAAPDRRRRAEQYEKQRVDPAQIRNAPVAACREKRADERHVLADDALGNADGLGQRQPEHAKTISHADA